MHQPQQSVALSNDFMFGSRLAFHHSLKGQQEIVFKKDKATLHVISKRCEDSKLFQLN